MVKINKTLVFYAHPGTQGHCSFILERVLRHLKSKKIDYEIIDLYKIKYDPVLVAKEHYSVGNKFVSNQNKEFQMKIEQADNIFFIYPVWWGSMPAILKGFFDRVFVAGFAFKFERGRPRPLLKGRRAFVFVTTGGSKLITRLLFGNRPFKLIKMHILGYCGIKTKIYHVDNATKFNQVQKKKIKQIVIKAFDDLF